MFYFNLLLYFFFLREKRRSDLDKKNCLISKNKNEVIRFYIRIGNYLYNLNLNTIHVCYFR